MSSRFDTLELPGIVSFKRIGDVEHYARENNFQTIVGIDEAGRGPLAGPVVAAAVCLSPDVSIDGVNDSKILNDKIREKLVPEIISTCYGWGISFVNSKIIDDINILQATKLAMINAAKLAEKRGKVADIWLIDGNQMLENTTRKQQAIVKGDALSIAIASASVLAKVYRDRWMKASSKVYDCYGFEKHKGYPTKAHRELIAKHGICPIHRKTFKGVKEFVK